MMMQLKLGIQLASLRLPFKQALQTAAELGVQAVEIDARSELKPHDLTRTAVRQIRKMLDDLNLRVCAVTLRTRRGYDVLDHLDERMDATRQAMQMAYDLGAPVVVNQVGRVPPESKGPQWDLMMQTLSELGRHGQKVGALLAADTGTESGADLRRLIEALPAGSLGVNFDPGNLIVNGFSATEAVRDLGQHVFHVHAKDGVRDLAIGRGIEVPVGRGTADFPQLLGVLEEFQYRGYFTVTRENAKNPLFEIGQSIEFLRAI